MSDPLSQLVGLLKPHAVFANVISGKGHWAVRYREYGRPSFCIMLDGRCQLAIDGHVPFTITAGDFILLPATPAFTLYSTAPAMPVVCDPDAIPNDGREVRYGDPHGTPDMRSLGGAFLFGGSDPHSRDRSLLVSLLPAVVHVRDASRLSQLVAMVAEETTHLHPGSAAALSRLVDLLLIEAMRATSAGSAPPGLLRGLGDERLACALTLMHAHIDRPWTVAQLAQAAALSRSTFYERFTRKLGLAPMEYLLAWRMQIAKALLQQGKLRTAQIAERIGYGSASAFSVAFQRCTGISPGRFMRANRTDSG